MYINNKVINIPRMFFTKEELLKNPESLTLYSYLYVKSFNYISVTNMIEIINDCWFAKGFCKLAPIRKIFKLLIDNNLININVLLDTINKKDIFHIEIIKNDDIAFKIESVVFVSYINIIKKNGWQILNYIIYNNIYKINKSLTQESMGSILGLNFKTIKIYTNILMDKQIINIQNGELLKVSSNKINRNPNKYIIKLECVDNYYYFNDKQNKIALKLINKIEQENNKRIIEKERMRKKLFTETDLEYYLIKNIELIEEEMQYIDHQVKVKRGRIDILARDKNNVLCIIELKIVSDCKDLIWQCAYYPTLYNELVRMITICPNYRDYVNASVQQLKYVEQLQYKVKNNDLSTIKINKFNK